MTDDKPIHSVRIARLFTLDRFRSPREHISLTPGLKGLGGHQGPQNDLETALHMFPIVDRGLGK